MDLGPRRRPALFKFEPHDGFPGALVVQTDRGHHLGTLVPVAGSPGIFRVFYLHGFIESIGLCRDRLIGAQALADYRGANTKIRWYEEAGLAGYLHEGPAGTPEDEIP